MLYLRPNVGPALSSAPLEDTVVVVVDEVRLGQVDSSLSGRAIFLPSKA